MRNDLVGSPLKVILNLMAASSRKLVERATIREFGLKIECQDVSTIESIYIKLTQFYSVMDKVSASDMVYRLASSAFMNMSPDRAGFDSRYPN